MKLCRYIAGNGDMFSHTLLQSEESWHFPLHHWIYGIYIKKVRLERLAISQRKITLHPQQHQQHTGAGALAVCCYMNHV